MADWVSPTRRAARVTFCSAINASNETSRFRLSSIDIHFDDIYHHNYLFFKCCRKAHVAREVAGWTGSAHRRTTP